jgi:hypothetical protein
VHALPQGSDACVPLSAPQTAALGPTGILAERAPRSCAFRPWA